MRRVERLAAPEVLSLPDGVGIKELRHAEIHFGSGATPKNAFEFKAYRHADVKSKLEAMFHGKCAYCETVYAASAAADVEHYRPKGKVAGCKEHPGYWWLAMEWTNLLPSCNDCNRMRKHAQRLPSEHKVVSGKGDRFPVEGRYVMTRGDVSAELPLLLDPCCDDPAQHLAFDFTTDIQVAIMVARAAEDGQLSLRGKKSIEIYGLNRSGLVKDRTRLMRQLTFMGDLVIELASLIQALEGDTVVNALPRGYAAGLSKRLRHLMIQTLEQLCALRQPDQPYSAMVDAWIEAFHARLV